MDKIVKLFSGMEDSELLQAVREISEDSERGIIREDGVVRKYARKMCEITDETIITALFSTEMNIYREAALRWALKK